jgi:hypothetical protein
LPVSYSDFPRLETLPASGAWPHGGVRTLVKADGVLVQMVDAWRRRRACKPSHASVISRLRGPQPI